MAIGIGSSWKEDSEYDDYDHGIVASHWRQDIEEIYDGPMIGRNYRDPQDPYGFKNRNRFKDEIDDIMSDFD